MALLKKPKPVRETQDALREVHRAEKNYQKAVRTGDSREVATASAQLMGAQWGQRVAQSRNGGRYWE